MMLTNQGDAFAPQNQAGMCQVFMSGAALGLTTPGTSVLLASGGYTKMALGATSSATGSLSIQRYLDPAGTIAQGAALSQALTAATPGVLNVTDGLPFASFTVTISGGTLSNVGLLFQAQ